MYKIPEMPLLAHCWVDFALPTTPDPLDAIEIQCSLSPLRPDEHFLRTPEGSARSTHIIRTIPLAGFRDSYTPDNPGSLFPCSLFEVPQYSGHFYLSVWHQVVGAGFPNEHSRIYVARDPLGLNTVTPPFIGFI